MCNAYFQCAHGHQYPDQFCPDGLLFNGEVCDHPQNVTCPINENESCTSGERIWYGDSEIAIASTDAGEWPNSQLGRVFDSNPNTFWHSCPKAQERTKTITIDFLVRNSIMGLYHMI